MGVGRGGCGLWTNANAFTVPIYAYLPDGEDVWIWIWIARIYDKHTEEWDVDQSTVGT